MLKLGDPDMLPLEVWDIADVTLPLLDSVTLELADPLVLWDTADVTLELADPLVLWDTADVTLPLLDSFRLALALWDTADVTLWDRLTVVDSLVLKLDVCVGKTEELNVANDVGDTEMDSDAVREAVMAVVGEGEAEAVAPIE
jgi:hypothetical protein